MSLNKEKITILLKFKALWGFLFPLVMGGIVLSRKYTFSSHEYNPERAEGKNNEIFQFIEVLRKPIYGLFNYLYILNNAFPPKIFAKGYTSVLYLIR